MDELREPMMDVTRQVNWVPSFGMDRELDWLAHMDDWMISKKRYWGLALPIYECGSCGNFEVIGSETELQERAVEGWDEFEGHTPHRPWIDAVKIACAKCGEKVSRIPDVGNPWLDAGIVAILDLNYRHDRAYWEQWFPADLISESFPGQFRNWFYAVHRGEHRADRQACLPQRLLLRPDARRKGRRDAQEQRQRDLVRGRRGVDGRRHHALAVRDGQPER